MHGNVDLAVGTAAVECSGGLREDFLPTLGQVALNMIRSRWPVLTDD